MLNRSSKSAMPSSRCRRSRTSGEGWAEPLMSWEKYPDEIPTRRAKLVLGDVALVEEGPHRVRFERDPQWVAR